MLKWLCMASNRFVALIAIDCSQSRFVLTDGGGHCRAIVV